jgi:hypothetical protein
MQSVPRFSDVEQWCGVVRVRVVVYSLVVADVLRSVTAIGGVQISGAAAVIVVHASHE